MGPDTAFSALRTERLVIRRFVASDAETFAAYRSEPEVARHQSWDTPFSVDQARLFIEQLASEHPDTPGTWFQFALVDVASDTHIGDVAASCDAADRRLASVGWTLAPHAQGQGYATEAATALLDYLFDRRSKHRVTAGCDPCNAASAALMERLGMRREAHFIQSEWAKGEWTDEYVYAVLSTEWAQRRER